MNLAKTDHRNVSYKTTTTFINKYLLIESIWVLKRGLGLEHGYGEFIWPDGRFYKEDFVRRQKIGKGDFKWADGRICKGEWKTWKQYGFSIKAM